MPIVDFLILTPLGEELKYLQSAWPGARIEKKLEPFTYYLSVASVPGSDAKALVVAAAMGSMGQAQSGTFTSEAILRWHPRHILLLGICGSVVGKKLPMGDVMVPEEIRGFDTGEVNDSDDGPRYTFRPTGHAPSLSLLDSARALTLDDSNLKSWRSDVVKLTAERKSVMPPDPGPVTLPPEPHASSGAKKRKLTWRPNLHVGEKQILASGNFVLKSKELAELLKSTIDSRISAVEMEAKGLFDAVRIYAERITGKAPSVLVIRGVSDYAGRDKALVDEQTGGLWRQRAAQGAALFAAHFISRRLVRRDDLGSVPLALLARFSKRPTAEARSLGLKPIVNGSCIIYDQFFESSDGVPNLTIEIEAQGVNDRATIQYALVRKEQGNRQIFEGVQGALRWSHVVPRSDKPYELGLAVVSDIPIPRLELRVKDEFGRCATRTDEFPS